MADPKDLLECYCGERFFAPKDLRVPFHTKYSPLKDYQNQQRDKLVAQKKAAATNPYELARIEHEIKEQGKRLPSDPPCKWSGKPCDNWPPTSSDRPRRAPKQLGKLLLQCQECEDGTGLVNNPRESVEFPLLCKYCGSVGSLKEFLYTPPQIYPVSEKGRVVAKPKTESEPAAPAYKPKLAAGIYRASDSPLRQKSEPSASSARGRFGAYSDDKDTRSQLEIDFVDGGKLTTRQYAAVRAVCVELAQRAFSERNLGMFGYRAYHPMLDSFAEKFEMAKAKTAALGIANQEAVEDLTYLIYWAALEDTTKRGGVAFKREDMAERGL